MKIILMVVVIGCLFTLIQTCMDKKCTKCQAHFIDSILTETCFQCQLNFVVNSQGQCQINVTKVVTVLLIGLIIMIGSLVGRRLLIHYFNQRKPKLTSAFYEEMERQARIRPEGLLERAYVPQTNRSLINDDNRQEKQIQLICGICEKQTNFRFRRVDLHAQCKHNYHSLCLKLKILQECKDPNDKHDFPCPICQKDMQFVSIYCQECNKRHRDLDMRSMVQVNKLRFFTCFMCKDRNRKKNIQKMSGKCWGLCSCCSCCLQLNHN